MGFVCVRARACVCAFQDNLGSQMSFYPYELINVQSCLVWLERLPLVLSEGSHTGHFLRRCAVCAILLTINLLCVYHIPLFSILSSTVGCGGDNSLHALSAPTALSARSRETGVSDHLMLQADTKMKVLTDCWLVYVLYKKEQHVCRAYFYSFKEGCSETGEAPAL